MANENQINEVEETTGALLPNLIDSYTQAVQSYDLETEFAKTKKNVSYKLVLGVFLFVVVFCFSAIMVTRYINDRLQNIPIEITSFDDINLRDLFDTVKRNQNDLDGVLAEIRILEQRKAQALGLLQDDLNNTTKVIQAKNLGPELTSEEILEATQLNSVAIQGVLDEFNPQIQELELYSQQIQEQIDQFDSRRIEQARVQEAQLSNQEQLFEIELEDQKAYYEELISNFQDNFQAEKDALLISQEELMAAREEVLNDIRNNELIAQFELYNPVFVDEAKELLVSFEDNAEEIQLTLNNYSQDLQTEIDLNTEDFTLIRDDLSKIQGILRRLNEIPYENSVPEGFDSFDYYLKDMVQRYEILWSSLLNSSLSKDQELAGYIEDLQSYKGREDVFLNALSDLLSRSREDGYVIKPLDSSEMIVYLDQRLNIEDGARAYIYREDALIASVKVYPGLNGVSEASLVNKASAFVSIQPFDKILVEID